MFTHFTGFDAHRVGTFTPMTRRCLTPKEMAAPNSGVVPSENGKMWRLA